jgi:hypothetical protein
MGRKEGEKAYVILGTFLCRDDLCSKNSSLVTFASRLLDWHLLNINELFQETLVFL